MAQIKRLVIKGCLGIEELVINPGKITLISGGNEKGKTSILETIEKALYNTKRRAKFVRTGEEKAYIELDTDDGINIKRTVKEDDAGLDEGTVKVTVDGEPVKAPETYLKALFGPGAKRGHAVFSFNPVDFMTKKDVEQTDVLLGLLPIVVTTEDAQKWFGVAPKVNYEKHGLQVLKALEEHFYEARREANTRMKATEDEIAAVTKRLPDNYVLGEWEGVSLSLLYGEVAAAKQANEDIAKTQAMVGGFDARKTAVVDKYEIKRKEAQETRDQDMIKAKESIEKSKGDFQLQIAAVNEDIAELRKRIQDLENRRIALETEIKNLEEMSLAEKAASLDKQLADRIEHINGLQDKELKDLQDDMDSGLQFLAITKATDIAPLQEKADHAEKMKSYVPLAMELGGLQKRFDAEKKQAENLDRCVETARMKPHELLSRVELPIEGLGIDGKGMVTIGGLPISNLSTAQQIRTCLNIARAIGKDNPLKIICVDKIEHLDETVRQEFIKQIEEDEGWQYFLTQVTDGELKVVTK